METVAFSKTNPVINWSIGFKKFWNSFLNNCELFSLFYFSEYATSTDCPNRLLAFAKFRNVLHSESHAAQFAPRQIINRFCNVAMENYKMGLWSLDLLQMCALHSGDSFALHLNNQDRLNELLVYFLSPEKSKAVSLQIQMKIYYLLRVSAID